MKAPQTMPELRNACGMILAGVCNGDVSNETARVALTAASRIIESVQAETRARALAFASQTIISSEMPLTSAFFENKKLESK